MDHGPATENGGAAGPDQYTMPVRRPDEARAYSLRADRRVGTERARDAEPAGLRR